MNRSTRFVAVIISVITSDDVLLAKIAVGLHDFVDGRVRLALDLEVFGYRLDDDVAVGQIVEFCTYAFSRLKRFAALFRRQCSFLDKFAKRLFDAGHSLFQNSSATSYDDSRISGSRGHLRDARPHQPTTQHADFRMSSIAI